MNYKEQRIPYSQVVKFGELLLDAVEARYGPDAVTTKLDEFLASLEKEPEIEAPRLVGTLTKPYGLNNYQRAEVGHPVYEFNDRYQITLQSLNPKILPYTVTFYKQDFKQCINFQ